MKPTITKVFLAIALHTLLLNSKNYTFLNYRNIKAAEGTNFYQNPLEAIQQAIELVKNIGRVRQVNVKQLQEPISFRKLIEYLPKPPSGWTAKEPEGQTTSFKDYGISQIEQTYVNDHKKITISIFDTAFDSALYTQFLLTTEFSQESTEGYNKSIKINNFPGREEYTYAEQNGSLRLLVSRFLVEIEGSNIRNAELREWWELIDREALTKVDSE